MKIIDTYKQRIQAEKEGIKIPTSVQSLIPISKIREDGIFRTGKNYSKMYSFSDINYAVATREAKENMFTNYCEILNGLDTEAISKITINNKNLDKRAFEEELFIPIQDDNLDTHRREYNDMIKDKVQTSRNNIEQERYLTISTQRKDILDAISFFNRIDVEIQDSFAGLSSNVTPIDCKERLKIYHDFYRVGREENYIFDYKQAMRKMHDFKSSICPSSMEVNKNYIQIGDKFVRTLYMREYANFIKDKMITDITDLQKILMLSISMLPIPTDEAVRIVDRLIMGVQTDKARFTQKQNQNGNFTAEIPYELDQRSNELHEFMDDLTSRDQRMIFATITLTLVADSLAELDSLTSSIQAIAGKYSCDFANLAFQQVDGLNTTLPIGVHKLPFKWRTLTTESTAVLMPFKAQEIRDKKGIYYGVNNVSRNLIVADRKVGINGNGFILGTSGSGKSFKAKEEIINLILRDDDVDIVCLDPEREYGELFRKLGGSVIEISANSPNHVNAMDITKYYGDGKDPVILKSEFILTLCDQLMEGEKITAVEKSIIDRCVRISYEDYIKNDYKGKAPTLVDFRKVLMAQPEKEARRMAIALERFSDGTLSTFAKPTNVDIHSQYLVYDIHELDTQLYTVGMLVVLDSIMNRITANRAIGRATFVYVDEIYLMFKKEYSATFLSELWKRIRKYGGIATGITQNISDLLQSKHAETMLSNSEFLILMKQSPSDLVKLAGLLNMSETQLSYISDKRSKHTDKHEGRGLLKYGGSIVPFVDRFPQNTELYKMLTTNPKEQEGYKHG